MVLAFYYLKKANAKGGDCINNSGYAKLPVSVKEESRKILDSVSKIFGAKVFRVLEKWTKFQNTLAFAATRTSTYRFIVFFPVF